MVIDVLLARARRAGLVVDLDGDRLLIQGPAALSALARAVREREAEVRELLARERGTPASASGFGPGVPENAGSAGTGTGTAPGVAGVRRIEIVFEDGPLGAVTPELARATAELRACLDRADRVEAAARARDEPVPDPDDPAVDYWAWCHAQPDPPPPDAGPWPRLTVTVDVDGDDRIISGPVCDAEGREGLP